MAYQFFGKKIDFLADKWLYFYGNELHGIQVEYVAPFCHLLENLEISLEHDVSDDAISYSSLVAFILRHLPRLQTWAVSETIHDSRTSNAFDAIQLLYSDRDGNPNRPKLSTRFVQELQSNKNIEWTINTPPPCTQSCFISYFCIII
jgi:hypothetical protein